MCVSGGYVVWGLRGSSYWPLATKSQGSKMISTSSQKIYADKKKYMRESHYRDTKSESVCAFLTSVQYYNLAILW